MKALVTGGAGFIGSHIVDALLQMNIDVVSIDNYSAGKHENLAHVNGKPNFTEGFCDVTDKETLARWMRGADIVFHNAASKKNICLNDPRRDLEVNAEGTFNVLELARDLGVKKVIHASTGSVYGEPVEFPQTEEHPLNPCSYYGVSKLAGERYALAFSKLYDMDVTVLRYFHVYGPRQDSSEYGGVVSIFADKISKGQPITIHGDGQQERSFTYVGDVVRANLFVAANPKTKGQVYNVASGIAVTIQQVAAKLMSFASREVPIEYADALIGDIRKFEVDSSKLEKLGFKYKTNLCKGLPICLNLPST
jgi:nucleoside-diphosphate-sugar epimerase